LSILSQRNGHAVTVTQTTWCLQMMILRPCHSVDTCVALCSCLLCQFDILWPDITVREHLVLYAVIKGATWAEAGSVAEQAAAEVRLHNIYDCTLFNTQSYSCLAWCGPGLRNQQHTCFLALVNPFAGAGCGLEPVLLLLLLQVGLSDKLRSLAGELSGGQRRKLSVAIAFLGNPAGAEHSTCSCMRPRCVLHCVAQQHSFFCMPCCWLHCGCSRQRLNMYGVTMLLLYWQGVLLRLCCACSGVP
jgi:hypothetical protein